MHSLIYLGLYLLPRKVLLTSRCRLLRWKFLTRYNIEGKEDKILKMLHACNTMKIFSGFLLEADVTYLSPFLLLGNNAHHEIPN